jgi:hypothetical protein
MLFVKIVISIDASSFGLGCLLAFVFLLLALHHT